MKSMIRSECAALCAAFVLLLAPTAHGAPGDPQLTVVGGSGTPGDSVAVSIELSGDAASTAASADLDLDFPADLVGVAEPITVSCQIAPRLEGTHQIGGRVPRPGLLRLAFFARGLEIRPLGNGALATCDFHIAADADGAPAQLLPEYVALGDSMGELMPVDGIAGEIAISAVSVLPTETPNQCLPGCAPAATPTSAPAPHCAADCNGDGVVTVPELISSINVALGRAPLSACPASDGDGDSAVLIEDLINGIGGAVGGCR